MDWWERGLMPRDRRRINRCQSRSNRLSSTASARRSLIFIAALTLNRFRSSLSRLRQSAGGLQQIFPARLSIGLARPAKLRPAPAEYLGSLTDGRASLL